MKWAGNKKLVLRGLGLGLVCLLFLIWNIFLSTQRQNLDGVFYSIEEKEILLKVGCAGKVEPLVQQTIRAELEGRKKIVHVRVGEPVEKGQLLMEITDDQIKILLTQKRNTMSNNKTSYLNAKKEYDLNKGLYQQQAVSRRDVENSRQAYKQALQQWKESQQQLALTEKKALGVRVLSPMDGYLIRNFVEKEEYISPGKELLIVAKLDQFAVRGKIDELDISKIQLGQKALIELDAFPGKELDGKVSWVGAQAGEGAFAEIDVLVDIKDKKGLALKPNLSAEVFIITGEIPKGISLPSRGVYSDSAGPYVFLKQAGGWVTKHPVEIAHTNGDQAIIKSGLVSGQSVLVPKEEN